MANWGAGFGGGATGALAGAELGSIFPGIGTGIGAIGGGLLGLFGGMNEEDPADKANPYLDQIPDALHPYYDPYVNMGRSMLPELQKQYGTLTGNPGDIISRIGAGYHESPGYKFRLSQSLNALKNASAAGGMVGTPQHEQQAAELAGNLADQDYEKYLSHGLNLYGLGLGGEEGLNKMGFQASGDLATDLANALKSHAGLAYEGAAGENKARGADMQNIVEMISAALGAKRGAMGGGSGFGGENIPKYFANAALG